MKTRLVAILGAAAIALGITALVLVGVGHRDAIAPVGDDALPEFSAPPQPVEPQVVEPQTVASTEHVLPTIEDIPEGLSADEYDHAVEWLTWSGLIDDCMTAAGFPEWYYTAYWEQPTGRWTDAFDDDDRLAAAALALGGNTGTGADYHWEDAGCAGAATEQLGISS